jgi:hypothetical protein
MKQKSTVSPPPTDTRFAFYHQNEALLYQFLLHEGLKAHQLLRKKPKLELLQKVIGSLELVSDKWHAPAGHLPRLIHYCSLLSVHFNDPSSELCKDLEAILCRACLTAKECYTAFKLEKKEQSQLYANLRRDIQAFMKILFSKIHAFRENASVLYFLLRHQEQFDALYREPIIMKTFNFFFPEGTKQAQLFLCEKFSKKGFHHLIPFIEQKLQKIENTQTAKTKRVP